MLRRVLSVLGAGVVALSVGSAPAVADVWGNVDCAQNPSPRCELGAGRGGPDRVLPPRGREFSGSGGMSGESGGGREPVAPKFSDPDLNLASCAYERSDFEPPPDVVRTSYGGGAGGGGVVAAVFAVGRPVAGPEPGRRVPGTCTSARRVVYGTRSTGRRSGSPTGSSRTAGSRSRPRRSWRRSRVGSSGCRRCGSRRVRRLSSWCGCRPGCGWTGRCGVRCRRRRRCRGCR